MCLCVREKETSEDRKVTQRDERGTSHKEERETSRGLMVFGTKLSLGTNLISFEMS